MRNVSVTLYEQSSKPPFRIHIYTPDTLTHHAHTLTLPSQERHPAYLNIWREIQNPKDGGGVHTG